MMKTNTIDNKIRLAAIIFVSLVVIITGSLWSYKSFISSDFIGAILGMIISVIILIFALIVFKRGNNDLKNGFPLKDERSQKVLEKASSKAFYISLYLLLLVGFLSDNIMKFRDVSQATSLIVGGMAILFAIFWAYYNRQEL